MWNENEFHENRLIYFRDVFDVFRATRADRRGSVVHVEEMPTDYRPVSTASDIRYDYRQHNETASSRKTWLEKLAEHWNIITK